MKGDAGVETSQCSRFKATSITLGLRRFSSAFVIGCALTGCAADLRNAVPIELADQVEVVGLEQVRFWGDGALPNAQHLSEVRLRQIRATRPELLNRKRHQKTSFLTLTGGGADGAFGAGFLNGWTATGKRPEFEIITGVSTGSLISLFAFLGSEYDDQLREVYTQYSTSDLLQKNIVAGLLGGSAISSSQPFFSLISQYVDRRVLAAVAREHKRGRRLLVGTTNLDVARPVIWNMGRIAEHNSPEALELFRKVLLASASIPGVFPPVYINVGLGGRVYKEMHVDGGTTNNVFLLPAKFDFQKISKRNRLMGRKQLFAIINTKAEPQPEVVKATTFGIAGRSIATLIKQQTSGDILRIYLSAKKNGMDFNLASVPDDFDHIMKEPFDKEYMNALYELGYKMAYDGYRWRKKPHGI